MDPIYKCVDLSFNYTLGEQTITALDNVNLEIQKGEFICLSGPSGSGKSTLLNLLGLIEPIQSGNIFFENKSFNSLTEKEKNVFRKYKLGFIFQFFNLSSVLNTSENVEYFLTCQGMKKAKRKKIVENSLKSVGIWDKKDAPIMKLSGGQRQRVAIARALAKTPIVLIADEPTSGLDSKTGLEIMNVLIKLNVESNVTIIIASHDSMVMERSKRVITLKDGKILEDLICS